MRFWGCFERLFFRFFSEVFRKVPRSFSGTPGGFWGTLGKNGSGVWGEEGSGRGRSPAVPRQLSAADWASAHLDQHWGLSRYSVGVDKSSPQEFARPWGVSTHRVRSGTLENPPGEFQVSFFRFVLPPEGCPRLVIPLKSGKLDPWNRRCHF